MSWLADTLRHYPEIALFLSLGIGYWVGGKSFKGFSLGAVTATLLAAIAIGQLGIQISVNVKSVFFLIFLFAVGYGVGPQFVRGIAKDGLPQALFSVVQCVLCLAAPIVAAKLAGYSIGSAAGLFAGSQTISASMGLATDAINRLALPADQIHPTFGRIPEPTIWFMNSVRLNVFIAVVGITAGPGFVSGLQQLGVSLFLWGIFATAVPLIIGMYIAKYIFRFHPAILLGACAGARTTTAALGMICDAARSQVPGLGYTVTYAVGNTLLTIWGMILVMLMT